MMKSMRYALTALLCYAAFWGAAHIGMLPVLQADAATDMPTQAKTSAEASSDLIRRFLIIR